MMMLNKMCPVHKAAWVLVLVGALNWGAIGLFGINLVDRLLGSVPMLEKIVYILVGASAVAVMLMHRCKMCHLDSHGAPAMKGPEPKQ